MKKVTLLITLLFILSACQSRPPAPVEVLPTPSRTPSPTGLPVSSPTQNATQVYQNTVEAKNTLIAGNATTRAADGTQTVLDQTATQAAQPTSTSTPTFTPNPTLPLPQGGALDYQLITPAPEIILDGLIKAWNSYRVGGSCGDECGTYQDVAQFGQVLNYEWHHLYPMGFSDNAFVPGTLDTTPVAFGGFWAPDAIVEMLQAFVLQYLNEQNVSLKEEIPFTGPGFEANASSLELDRDTTPEWLVNVSFPTYELVVWLVLDQDGEGHYTLLNTPLLGGPYIYEYDTKAIQVEDFTGDGITDVIFLDDHYVMGGLSVIHFYITKGTANGLELISEVDASYNGFSPYEYHYAWLPADGGKLSSLRIIEITHWRWNCDTQTFTDYRWVGGTERTTVTKDEPDSVACALGRSVSPFDLPDNSIAIALLEHALKLNQTNLSLTPAEILYVHYRLALLYILEKQTGLANLHLDQIQAMGEAGEPEIAVNLWGQINSLRESGTMLPYSLCLAAENIGLPYLYDFYYGVQAFPYQGLEDGYPTALCQTNDLHVEIMNQVAPSPKESPEELFRNAGLPVLFAQQVALNSPELAWLVVIEERGPDEITMGGFVSTSDDRILYGYLEGVGWKRIIPSLLPANFTWVNRDFTGDGISEIGIAALSEFDTCEDNEIRYDILIISSVGYGYTSSEEDWLCLSNGLELDWNQIMQDQNGDGLADRAVDGFFNVPFDDPTQLTGQKVEPTWLINFRMELDDIGDRIDKATLITNLDDLFFSSPNPVLLRPTIEDYLARWNSSHPLDTHLQAHLTYLLALTYELEGDDPQAVELFYDLWANHPDTLWAYLAAARLELK